MIIYEEDWLCSLIFRYKGSVVVKAALHAVPSVAFAVLMLELENRWPGKRQEWGIEQLANTLYWNAAMAVLAVLLGFRIRQALARFWEGTGLLHQMRGEWFDSVSCCVTFSRAAMETQPDAVKGFRHTLIRLMSFCHASALEEIAGDDHEELETIDVLGLDVPTLRVLKDCKDIHGFNRVEVLLHMTQSLITSAHDKGVLKVPPPILSRVYQTLSRGFVNLLNAKKITDTRFPFPFAQLISCLLVLHTVLTPILLTGRTDTKLSAALLTFVPLFGCFSLNFIAVQLENPFGHDDNDLPLAHFQVEMNCSLLMLLHETADHVASTSQRCVWSFDDLKDAIAVVDEAGQQSGYANRGKGSGSGPGTRQRIQSQIRCRNLSRFESVDSDEVVPTYRSGRETLVARLTQGSSPKATRSSDARSSISVECKASTSSSLQSPQDEIREGGSCSETAGDMAGAGAKADQPPEEEGKAQPVPATKRAPESVKQAKESGFSVSVFEHESTADTMAKSSVSDCQVVCVKAGAPERAENGKSDESIIFLPVPHEGSLQIVDVASREASRVKSPGGKLSPRCDGESDTYIMAQTEFANALRRWSCLLQDQVRELSTAFETLNVMSNRFMAVEAVRCRHQEGSAFGTLHSAVIV